MPLADVLLDDLQDRLSDAEAARGRLLADDGFAQVISCRPGEIRAGVDDYPQRFKVKINWDPYDPGAVAFTCSCGAAPSRACAHARRRRAGLRARLGA